MICCSMIAASEQRNSVPTQLARLADNVVLVYGCIIEALICVLLVFTPGVQEVINTTQHTYTHTHTHGGCAHA
jgi:hypothetical protein